MFLEKILYATDFSETSVSALGYVIQLRNAGCKEVILVHVLDARKTEEVLAEPSGGDEPSGEYERQIAGRILNNARQELKTIERALEAEQFLVRTFLVNGNPSREINRIADAECAGMIVIGSHGKTNLLHRLMGSISLGVIENATRPVLIVRRSEEQ
ncbi:MAG TPA: universal stress protein [Methanoregulaceae archaeon]|jgi:nucleotide-binding universal stress UspA family protein|nr:universal stress protein [Methanoregulaceae archaeon]